MSGVQAETSVAELADANLFDVEAPIAVHYSRSSISSVPLLSYRDSTHDLKFAGADITRTATPVGQLVTVTVELVPDAFVRTFTLVVPVIRLRMGGEVGFEALGIELTDRSGAFVPPPGPDGVLQTYRIHQLAGTARSVTF